jgi:hypothetical protein
MRVGLEVPTAFWEVSLCSLLNRHQGFGGNGSPSWGYERQRFYFTLYQTTRTDTPDDGNLRNKDYVARFIEAYFIGMACFMDYSRKLCQSKGERYWKKERTER